MLLTVCLIAGFWVLKWFGQTVAGTNTTETSLNYLLKDGYWNMACNRNWTQYDSVCQPDWMTLECNYDTREDLTYFIWTSKVWGASNVIIDLSPSIYVASDSDCRYECEAKGCDLSKLGDGTPDASCDYPEWGYDLGDFYYDCNNYWWTNVEWIGDDYCDSYCDNIKCNLDNGDCGFCKSGSGCTKEMYYNAACD